MNSPLPQRHYGLDWLRIAAFAILILYHIGMVFVPWGFHVKLPGADWTTVPMLASAPWRLSLLFVVSGYASRALHRRGGRTAAFAANRTSRLIVPLIFGIAVVVPPQSWVELVTKHAYAGSFATFWTHDYFRFSTLAGIVLPTWNHLWFVLYLWLYTMLLVVVLAIAPAGLRNAAQMAFSRIFTGTRALLLPMAWLIVVSTLLFPGVGETHALFGDWVAHAIYLPAFLFGFAMAAAPGTLATFARLWKPAAAMALVAYAIVAGIELNWPVQTMPQPWGRIFSIARGVEGWAAIAALIGIAETFLNRDHPARAMLTEAVFPFYIIHQTIIVMVAYWLIPAALPPFVNFAVLIVATVAGCWAFYLIGRAIPWARPLIGLRRKARPRIAPTKPALAH
ncbi:acyltransferase family protein [Sphingomonas sp. SUN019]|uniref:acyltransferase family protein n=1 Tax=Sphingomonas sp. SUN019 TaxID=2937788 RepID=UPI0021642087|nr:acyltransferase family protein [Sphingomonas sp. SUN019]UVO51253.1 acyltransferase family protein [Sphingomonas sp. SUN019]